MSWWWANLFAKLLQDWKDMGEKDIYLVRLVFFFVEWTSSFMPYSWQSAKQEEKLWPELIFNIFGGPKFAYFLVCQKTASASATEILDSFMDVIVWFNIGSVCKRFSSRWCAFNIWIWCSFMHDLLKRFFLLMDIMIWASYFVLNSKYQRLEILL